MSACTEHVWIQTHRRVDEKFPFILPLVELKKPNLQFQNQSDTPVLLPKEQLIDKIIFALWQEYKLGGEKKG